MYCPSGNNAGPYFSLGIAKGSTGSESTTNQYNKAPPSVYYLHKQLKIDKAARKSAAKKRTQSMETIKMIRPRFDNSNQLRDEITTPGVASMFIEDSTPEESASPCRRSKEAHGKQDTLRSLK